MPRHLCLNRLSLSSLKENSVHVYVRYADSGSARVHINIKKQVDAVLFTLFVRHLNSIRRRPADDALHVAYKPRSSLSA